MLSDLRDFLSADFALLVAVYAGPAVFAFALCVGATVQDVRAAIVNRRRLAARFHLRRNA